MVKKTFLLVTAMILAHYGVMSQNLMKQEFHNLPFKMPAVEIPVFKTDTFNIINYGALGTGTFLNTQAIQKAINVCNQKGGGVVFIPKGYWLTGPIELRSNVNLHLAFGALLKFSGDKDLYPIALGYWEGVSAYRCQSPITGLNLENIAITGNGIIDGTGEAWRPVKKEKLTENQWNTLIKNGGITNESKKTWYPDAGALKGEILVTSETFNYNNKELLEETKRYFRPMLISLIRSKRILLDGPTFQNSPAWNIHPLMCEHLTIRNITVRNPWFSQNGDGIDIESCRIGSLTNSRFDVGDDAICIKSGKDEEGRKRAMPTELFVIYNCTVYHGHGGFVVGSEMSGGVRNMYVSDCTFLGTDCGLRFKSNRGRGGIVENIWMKNIYMADIPTEAIRFNLFYGGKSALEEAGNVVIDEAENKIDETTPQFQNMYFEDVWVTNAQAAVLVRGLPEMPVRNIQIKNLNVETKQGINCLYGENIQFNELNLLVKEKEAINIQNSNSILLNDLNVTGFSEKMVVIKGAKTKNIQIKGSEKPITSNDIILIETNPSEVKLK